MSPQAVVSIVKNETPPDRDRTPAMVREAIDLVGGIDTYVQPGDNVVIKANVFAPFLSSV